MVGVGGAQYIHTLIASVPTATNAAYYAKIVVEQSVLRSLIQQVLELLNWVIHAMVAKLMK